LAREENFPRQKFHIQSSANKTVMPIKSSTMLPISNSFEKAPESSKASIEKYSRNNTKQKVGERGYN